MKGRQMKDKKITHIDIKLPKSWGEMSQKQLIFFYRLLNVEQSIEALILMCFLKWGDIKVIGKIKDSDEFLLRKKKDFFFLSAQDIHDMMRTLNFLKEIPKTPAVIQKYGRHKAVDNLFRGVRFGSYLSCVSIWSEMMKSPNIDADKLRSLVEILYGCRPKSVRGEYFSCIVFWMSSIQEFFAKRFPDLFSPASSSDGQGSLGASAQSSFQDSSNAMIRALTKGDVLKEMEVLDIDVWRALTELNAQAKETKSINDSIKQK